VANSRKTITSEQFRQATADIKTASGVNLSVADIAEGTGLSKAYISEFRNDTRNLTGAQQAQLRTFLDNQCAENGIDFPEGDESVPMPKVPGTLVTHSLKPSITLSDAIPAEERDRILKYMDTNDAEISSLLRKKVNTGLLGGYTEDTEADIRKLFGLMSANYVAFRMLIGRNIVNAIKADFEPKTLEDVVSKFFAKSGFNELAESEQVAQKATSKLASSTASVGGAK
jgi:transcriptional regulator with XRE-family HTH domain